MKTNSKFIYVLCLIFLTIISCSDDNPLTDSAQNNNNNNNEVTYTISDLQGTWLRTGGNHTGNIGMVIEVTDNDGVIVDPVDSEFGSDYNYYSAIIDFQSDDFIWIIVDAGGSGNYQEWTRQ